MDLGAYFLSWATYGTRVREGADEKKALAAARRLSEPVYKLNERGRAVVEAAILELASYHEWLVVAHDVQERWVHVVVYAVDLPPAQVAGQMKSWATRRLREAGLATGRKHVWTRRPTLCRIADEPTLSSADEFVAARAGEPPRVEVPLISAEDLKVVRRFARALDGEDYETALALLDPACVYSLRGETIEGAAAVVASYKGNGDEAAVKFDSIAYTSAVRVGTGMDAGWGVIRFGDHITHTVGGRGVVGGEVLRHDHFCEQRVKVENGRIVRIEHRDLAGEVEGLARFKREAGLG